MKTAKHLLVCALVVIFFNYTLAVAYPSGDQWRYQQTQTGSQEKAPFGWLAICAIIIVAAIATVAIIKVIKEDHIAISASISCQGIDVDIDDVNIDVGCVGDVGPGDTLYAEIDYEVELTFINDSDFTEYVVYTPTAFQMEMGNLGEGQNINIESSMRLYMYDETNEVYLLDEAIVANGDTVATDSALPSAFTIAIPPHDSVVVTARYELDAHGYGTTPSGCVDVFGLEHCPLGQAVLEVDGEGNLVISNIGSSGEDGVTINVPSNLESFDAFMLPLGDPSDPGNPIPDGAFIEMTTRGTVAGIPDQVIAINHCEDMGSTVTATMDFSAIGPNSLLVEHSCEGSVTSQYGWWDNIVDFVCSIWPDTWDVSWIDLSIDWEFSCHPVMAAGGDIISTDLLEVSAIQPSHQITGYSSVTLTAKDIPTITIYKEEYTVPQITDHILPGQNLTFAWYQDGTMLTDVEWEYDFAVFGDLSPTRHNHTGLLNFRETYPEYDGLAVYFIFYPPPGANGWRQTIISPNGVSDVYAYNITGVPSDVDWSVPDLLPATANNFDTIYTAVDLGLYCLNNPTGFANGEWENGQTLNDLQIAIVDGQPADCDGIYWAVSEFDVSGSRGDNPVPVGGEKDLLNTSEYPGDLLIAAAHANRTLEWPSGCCNVPGDANDDDEVNIADIVFAVNYIFKGGQAPSCFNKGDVNGDCMYNLADAVFLLNCVFKGGPPPTCGCVD